MRTRVLVIALALSAGARAACAEKLLDQPVRGTAPRAAGVPGGGTASSTVYYDNTALPYGYIFWSGAQPRLAMDDIQLSPPGGALYYTNEHTIGWYNDLAEDFDLYAHFWDDLSLTTADPANNAFLSGYYIAVRNLPPGAWYAVVDLSGGWSVTFPDDSFGLELQFLEPGSTTPSNTGTPIFPMSGGGPAVGYSNDVYFRDADGNGRYNVPPDNRYFGGPPYLANFFAALSDNGQGDAEPCCPADTNCDGSINGFDITNFIECLSGGCVNPCSPCVGDMNDDGSVNGFDISGFISALGGAGQILGTHFTQMDFEFIGGNSYYNTAWGELDLTYQSAPHTMYLNLNVNGQWVVQNIPVVSGRGTCSQQTMSYAFGLGTPPGYDVTSITYGISLTSDTKPAPPALSETAAVEEETEALGSGREGETMDVNPAGPVHPLKGADEEPEPVRPASRKNFPNQECGPAECCPAAVSNSLQWLKKTHKIPDAKMKAADITIDKMKDATEWTEGGVGLGWHEKKDTYMKANGLPIETKTVTIDKLKAEMDNNCDCEIDGKVHVAAIISVTKMKDGKYSIEVRHDTNQNDNEDGTKDETVVYDPSTGLCEGGKWLDGKTVDNFVVECYKPGK